MQVKREIFVHPEDEDGKWFSLVCVASYLLKLHGTSFMINARILGGVPGRLLLSSWPTYINIHSDIVES